MLLAVDVGNTNINVGVFKDTSIEASFRLTTAIPRTSDEYGFLIKDLLEHNRIPKDAIENCIISSVVPYVMHSLVSGIIKYFDLYPMIVSSDLDMDIKVASYNARTVGADRLVDATAAFSIYGGPVVIVDFGTATTYDYIDKDGVFVAGITAPGIRISSKALSDFAASLPEIEIVRPDTILAKDTVSSMQAGLFYGQIGQTEHIIKEIKRETGHDKLLVVATGGLGDMISQSTDAIDIYDPNLTLSGMRILFEKNKNKTNERT